MEWTLFVVVLHVDDGAHLDQLVHRPEVSFLARVVQRGAAVVVLLVQVIPDKLQEEKHLYSMYIICSTTKPTHCVQYLEISRSISTYAQHFVTHKAAVIAVQVVPQAADKQYVHGLPLKGEWTSSP